MKLSNFISMHHAKVLWRLLIAVFVISASFFTACEASTSSSDGGASTIPGPPTGISLTPGNTTVTVSWIAPANNGGATISDYTVYWDTATGVSKATSNKKSVGGTGTTLTVDGLTNGVTYYFAVTATNSVGESDVSIERQASPSATAVAPDVPTGITLTPGNESVTVTWNAPANNGGAAISDYTVYWDTATGVSKATSNKKSVVGTRTTLTVDGLTNGVTYYFAVTATNSVGESDVSIEGPASPSATAVAPDVPTGITLTPGNESVTVTWNAPANNGGAAISDYTVYWDTATGVSKATSNKKSVGGTGTTLTVDGLTNGIMYYFVVTATNSAGESDASTEVFATPGVVSYTVTYNLNGATGTAPNPATVNHGDTIASTPTEPTRKDYTFNGWYDDYTGGNEFSFGTSGTAVTANITLYAGWAIVESTTTYSIGDTGPAGGIVFYVKTSYSDGWRYMEASTINTSTGIGWGGYGTSIETPTDIGTGKVNTKAIVNKLGSGNYAARLCYDLVQGGYDDWFLLSKDELNELYKQKNTVGGLGSTLYWSSSGSGSNFAWEQYFLNGYQNFLSRSIDLHVRAVRAF